MIIAQLKNGKILHIHHDRFSVYDGELRLFSLQVSCRVNTSLTEGEEDIDRNLRYVGQKDNTFCWAAQSAHWSEKTYTLTLYDTCFTLGVTVKGSGPVETVDYCRDGAGIDGSRFAVAGYLAVNAQNNTHDSASHLIDRDPGELTPMRVAPPPFVFPMWNDYNTRHCGLGVVAKAGEHNFRKLDLRAPRNGWAENGLWLTLHCLGYTQVRGQWETPLLWGGFGESDYDVLRAYADFQYDVMGFSRGTPYNERPLWWRMPIFCGWGEQCALRNREHGPNAPYYARESYYRTFAQKLDELRLPAGMIMIDDKWQTQYGTLEVDTERWPNLRGFVEEQHAAGRRVILWMKAWDKEGLPDDECLKVDGEAYRADPTNPKYLARLRTAIHHLLSDEPGCCGCDGFKVDFTDCYPWMAGADIYEKGVCGLELMKRLFHAIHTYMKEVKPDALMNMSSVHPYFAQDCDMYRFNDYDGDLRSPLSVMRFRAEYAGAVMPDTPVDTDGFGGPTRYEDLQAQLYKSRIGVPCLYSFPTHFTSEDWDLLRADWQAYIEKEKKK